MPANTTSCTGCGTVLPVHSPDGLCSRCLLARGLDLLADTPTLPTAEALEDVSVPATPFTGALATPSPPWDGACFIAISNRATSCSTPTASRT